MTVEHCHNSSGCCGKHPVSENIQKSELELKAQMFADFQWTPESYQHKQNNCLLALMIANETGLEPFFIMRNLKFTDNNVIWHPGVVTMLLGGLADFRNIQSMYFNSGQAISIFAAAKSTGTVFKSEKLHIAPIINSSWLKAAMAFWRLDEAVLTEYYAVFMFMKEFAPELFLKIPFLENLYSAFENSNSKEIELLLPVNISRISEKLKEIGSPFSAREIIDFVRNQENQFHLELVLANLESITAELAMENKNV